MIFLHHVTIFIAIFFVSKALSLPVVGSTMFHKSKILLDLGFLKVLPMSCRPRKAMGMNELHVHSGPHAKSKAVVSLLATFAIFTPAFFPV